MKSIVNLSLAASLLLVAATNVKAAVVGGEEPTPAKPSIASEVVLITPYTPIAQYNLLGAYAPTGDKDWDPTTEESRNAKHRSYGEFYFGWNNWRNGDGQATMDPVNVQTTKLDFWNSMTWGFGFGTRTRIGEGKFGIRYGVQFNWHFYRLKGNTVLEKTQNPDGISFIRDNTQNYKKSTYRNTFLDLPILLDIDLRKNAYKGLTLAAGGYAGIRLGTSTKVKYTDAVGDDVKIETHDPTYGNLWRYGLMGQIGFGEFKITGKWDLNTIFEQGDYVTPDYQAFSFTIGWVMP